MTRLVTRLSKPLAIAFLAAAPWAAQAADIATGEKAFMRVCANCHAPDALGAEGPPLLPLVHGPQTILEITRSGLNMMPPLPTATITDDEIASVALYLASKKAK